LLLDIVCFQSIFHHADFLLFNAILTFCPPSSNISWLMKRVLLAVAILIGISIIGAGCFSLKKENVAKILPAGPRPADFTGVSSEEAAKRINFVQGSQIEIRQTYLGMGAKQAEELSDGDKTGVRIITIERFAPANYANLNWSLSQNVETQSSVQARAAYEAGETDVKPEFETERLTVVGSLNNLDLKNSHKLFLPAYWPTDQAEIAGLSAIWVSVDVLEELQKTKNSTIYFGILDSTLFGAMGSAKEFSDSIKALQTDVSKTSSAIEVDLTKADDPSDWELMVNGEKVTVQVIKARNWFGEIVVLNNPQNPLILKMTFNPTSAETLASLSGADFLKSLLGYEVTQLNGVQ
jgi:hypothetical protein